MAQLVAFPAPSTDPRPRKARADGDGTYGKILMFTGVWQERHAENEERSKTPPRKGRRKQKP